MSWVEENPLMLSLSKHERASFDKLRTSGLEVRAPYPSRLTSLATLISHASPQGSLALCGLAAVGIYLVGFTLPYSIPGTFAKPLLDFANITGPSPGSTVAFIVAAGGLFALYAVSVRLCGRLEGSRAALGIVIGLGPLAAFALLPMYPLFSLDVFYYMSADRIWSVYRENPFIVPPLQGAHDPFFPYTAWGHYPLPYGPLWPWITAAASALADDPVASTLMAFKALAVVGYLACVPAVYWAVRAVRPDRALAGTCIFAWNPVVLLELAGGAHNDAIALVPAVLGLGFWARRASVTATAALTVSFLVKATVAVAVPALLWASFRRALADGRLPRWVLTHLGLAIGLSVLAWLPFWGAAATPLLRESDQYYHSLSALVMAAVPTPFRGAGLRAVQIALVAAFALYYVSQLRALAEEGEPAVRSLWRILVLYFVVVSPFYSGWYAIWPTVCAALLAERRTTILNTLLCIGGLATYLVQFVVRPLGGPAIGAVQLSALGMLAAFGPFLLGWAYLAWRQRRNGLIVSSP